MTLCLQLIWLCRTIIGKLFLIFLVYCLHSLTPTGEYENVYGNVDE